MERVTSRRGFLALMGAASIAGATIRASAQETTPGPANRPATRGVVIVPEDLTLADWPERAARAGLTTIGMHHPTSPRALKDFMRTDPAERFLEQCAKLGLQVEYELHAMAELLPRDLFGMDPAMFRMNEKGERAADWNCCVHSKRALEIITENALKLANDLKPTTGRYFFWGDDGGDWCQCADCKGLSGAEQALVFENAIIQALRKGQPEAQLAHIAYQKTLPAPRQVKPEPGVFLEYAPIQRRHDIPYEQQRDPGIADGLTALDENLEVFPRETAQALEYWLDVSRFSGWKRPSSKVPWNRAVLEADVKTYRERGIRHITTFAAWLDADYVERFGEPYFLQEYGEVLSSAR